MTMGNVLTVQCMCVLSRMLQSIRFMQTKLMSASDQKHTLSVKGMLH
uniref:Uncharacterized protein n=1 Tax=Anguilla anguilla TaxID=7936 RepID=A0A0E9TZ48_ANGAN